jgi:cardiolipin synthase A/B
MKLSTFFLIVMYALNFASIISIVFIRHNDTGVTLAWLLIFLFVPYIGFILYFFFGSTFRIRYMTNKYGMNDIEDKYNENFQSHLGETAFEEIQFNEPETKKYSDMIVMNTRSAMNCYTQDNTVELLIDAEEKFARMLEEIESATTSIDVLYFIIRAKDDIGKKFISLLEKKAGEGVRVNLIYDFIGCMKTHMSDFKGLKKAGGRVYRFLPTVLGSFIYVNYRQHRKIVIIDKKIAYTGGINVGDEYFGLKNGKPWRDTSIRLTGTSVDALHIRFLADLFFLENQSNKYNYTDGNNEEVYPSMELSKSSKAGNVGVQILSSGPSSKYETIRDSYVKLIISAKKYLYIQSPYFVPDKTLIECLRLAAASGVDVRIMLPGIPDKIYVHYVTLSYLEELLTAGIKVYLHKGFIHAKTIVIDDHVSTVGTTNVDIRSFKLDYEVNALIYNTTFAKNCMDVFLKDIKDCRELDLRAYNKRNLWHKIFESLCRLIAPLA